MLTSTQKTAARHEEQDAPAVEEQDDRSGATARSLAVVARESGDPQAMVEAQRTTERVEPLPADLRATFERRHRISLDDVRVVVSSEATAMGAAAFTRGSDIVVAPEHHAPGAAAGQRLIGHELAHVVQQRQGRVSAGADGLNDESALEAEADQLGDRAVAEPGRADDEAQEQAQAQAQTPSTSVAGPVQRKVTVNRVAADHADAAGLHAKTLDEFLTHIRKQIDWPRELSEDEAKDLRALIARVTALPAIANACGEFTVGSLLALAAGDWASVEKYSRGVDSPRDPPTARLQREPTLAEAKALGAAVTKLEAAVGGSCLYHIAHYAKIKLLMGDGMIDAFCNYVKLQKPVLQAEADETGKDELKSYHAVKSQFDPLGLSGMLPRIRNLHRFQPDALIGLAVNSLDFTRMRPLTLILHSSMDHNAAFHQDPNLTAVIANPTFNTLMIEGAEKLEDVTPQVGELARAYGQRGKIAQAMIAGHGGPRGIQLAGTVSEQAPTAPGEEPTMVEHNDSVELDGDKDAKKKADDLFDAILGNLDSSASGRVVFNACLTASTEVSIDDSSATSPEDQIKATIRDKPNLTDYLSRRARDAGITADVRGASGSFGEVGLADASGKLDIINPDDPYLTSPKADYIEYGTEAEGVMRAVLELWEDPTGKATKPVWLDRVEKRLAAPVTGEWNHTIIQTLFKLAGGKYKANAKGIQSLIPVAHPINQLFNPSEADVSHVSDLRDHPEAVEILKELAKDTASFVGLPRLVLLQIWLKKDPGKRADFLTECGNWKVSDAETHIDTGELGAAELTAMLGKTASPSKGQLVLALVDRFTTPHAASKDFLLHLLGTGDEFPAALDVKGLLGTRGVDGALASIGRGAFADPAELTEKKGPRTEDGNLDIDNDDMNESYAEPVHRPGKVVNCYVLRVRKRPSMKAAELDFLHAGDEVFVLGHLRGWDVIDWHGTPAFVGASFIER